MLNDAEKENLRKQLEGELVTPGDAAYDEARRIFNVMIDRHPAAIVRCAAASDVVAAVQFAREHDLRVSIKGAGHNVSGNAICDNGVMIDNSRPPSKHP